MIDICIMAHPSRKENVEKLLTQLNLPKTAVFWDDREIGGDAMYTARKAWTSPIPENCTHRLVLQDDVELCDNFIEIVEQVANKFSNQIVSLFHCEDFFNKTDRYQLTNFLWGCAIMIPATQVNNCWEFVDKIPTTTWYKYAKDIILHDDDCIVAWAVTNNIPIINTVPSLVQHIGDDSLVGCKEKRIAKDFIKSPPITGW